jgi:hypothetical protein
MTLRTLDYNLDSLIERGLLTKTLQKRENGSYRSSLYQIFLPALAEGGDEGSEKSAPGGEKIAPPLAQNLHYPSAGSARGGAESAPLEPTTDPVFESKTTTTTTGGGEFANNQSRTQGMDMVEEYLELILIYGGKGDKRPGDPFGVRDSARDRIMTRQGGKLSDRDWEQLQRWQKLKWKSEQSRKADAQTGLSESNSDDQDKQKYEEEEFRIWMESLPDERRIELDSQRKRGSLGMAEPLSVVLVRAWKEETGRPPDGTPWTAEF